MCVSAHMWLTNIKVLAVCDYSLYCRFTMLTLSPIKHNTHIKIHGKNSTRSFSRFSLHLAQSQRFPPFFDRLVAADIANSCIEFRRYSILLGICASKQNPNNAQLNVYQLELACYASDQLEQQQQQQSTLSIDSG